MFKKDNIQQSINIFSQNDQEGGSASGPSSSLTTGLRPTDKLLNDPNLPSSWRAYFDPISRIYFYYNIDRNLYQYDHPFPPIHSPENTILKDSTTAFLPQGWMKLMTSSKERDSSDHKQNAGIPYYWHTSAETRWRHPNPPPNPLNMIEVAYATLLPPFKKYIDPTTSKPFYSSSETEETQWDFPDSSFNPGPSAAQKQSSAQQQAASSALQQRDSSAQQQTASSALQQRSSSAQQQAASSSVQQAASSAVQQIASSAQQQVASSALQQAESSARYNRDISDYIAQINAIKAEIRTLQQDTNSRISTVYSPNASVTMASLGALKENIRLLVEKQNKIHTIAKNLFALGNDYQDTDLQTIIPNTELTGMGYTYVFDVLRNKRLVLDLNKKIIQNHVSPFRA